MDDASTVGALPYASRPDPFVAGYQRFPGLLAHPPRLLDTAHVLDELKELVHRGWLSRGAISPDGPRRAPLVAPRHVYNEMYRDDGFGHADKFEKLAEQSTNEGWPTDPAVLRRAFESRMLPMIHFVETGTLFDEHEVVLSVGNPSDVPTARLAVLLALGRPVVLSKDRHLRRPGLAAATQGVLLQGFAAMETTELSVYATGYVSLSAVRRVNRVVNQFSDNLGVKPAVTWVAATIITGFLLYWILQTPERRTIAGKVVQPIAGLYVTAVRGGQQAQHALADLSVPVPPTPNLAQRIAAALLDMGRRHSVDSIHHALTASAFGTGPSNTEIEATLHALPCFVPAEGGNWQLGEVLRPPAMATVGTH